MTREEAMELIERMPYIRTIMMGSDKIRLALLIEAMQSDDPVEWVKVIKTDYVRRNDKSAKRLPSKEESQTAKTAKDKLYHELSSALEIPPEELEEFIVQHISAML